MITPKRKVKCDICKQWFTRWNTFQKVCQNPECIIENAKRQKTKSKRKAVKEFRESDKTFLIKIAQQVFNKYIRTRDGKKCISCGSTNRQIHAGHFRPQGRNAKLRFNVLNVHSQCSICNNHLSGNLVAYREALIEKIGIDKVECLENSNEPTKYDVDYLKRLIDIFKRKTKLYETKFR